MSFLIYTEDRGVRRWFFNTDVNMWVWLGGKPTRFETYEEAENVLATLMLLYPELMSIAHDIGVVDSSKLGNVWKT